MRNRIPFFGAWGGEVMNSTAGASTEKRRLVRLLPLLMLAFALLLAALAPEAYAWRAESETPTGRDYLFQLVRSRFGTLVMVFCGFGGFVTLYMQRVGNKGKQVPMLGIAMLLIAIALFLMRTMVTSGLMGAQYLDYGR